VNEEQISGNLFPLLDADDLPDLNLAPVLQLKLTAFLDCSRRPIIDILVRLVPLIVFIGLLQHGEEEDCCECPYH
jgi:hypothetical protein